MRRVVSHFCHRCCTLLLLPRLTKLLLEEEGSPVLPLLLVFGIWKNATITTVCWVQDRCCYSCSVLPPSSLEEDAATVTIEACQGRSY
ncbi:hypothetical protein AHAS_Ahas20G0106200 [Arachis hypogaea]